MDKHFKWKMLFIIGVTAFCLWKVYPPQEKIHLGLDLKGGMQLLLKIDLSKLPKEAQKDASERAVEVIRNRIDEFGVSEPIITRQGADEVVVQLPGITDRQRAKDIIGRTAHLEFQLVSDDVTIMSQIEGGKKVDGYDVKEYKEGAGSRKVLVQSLAVLTGDHLTNASVGFDQYGSAIVQLQFDKEGAEIFDKTTFQNIGRQLAIVLDGKVHSAPVIRDRIPNGTAQISGNFTPEEASDLSLILRAGALPAPVEVVEERTVGPSLGQDSINKGLKSGLIGVLLVVLFMPGYYLLAGLIADIGLIFYSIAVFGALAAFGAALTLPGIAGLILSVGMAVDANVLIFERMREELAAGRTPRAAVSAGFHRAFSAILDSNLTTLLTALLLFMFGTGTVKGFAVTLSIGILASMFSAILVTRVVLDMLLASNPGLKFKMLHIVRPTKINFLKNRVLAYIFSSLMLLLGVAALFMRGANNYGVEFTGGLLSQVKFHKDVNITDLRAKLEAAGLKGLMIQRYGEVSENQFVIKSTDSDTHRLEQIATEISGTGGYELQRVEKIGPSVSKDLTRKALYAVFWSAVGILIYLAFRFEWRFAAAAVVALVHDTLFSFGVYALTGHEINLAAIAGILTIMGYSVNDTIITFDRIRDNLKIMRKKPLDEIVNTSINETLSRTIITSFTTILSAVALFVFGGSAMHDFAFILLVGFSAGIYSTVFVASSLAVDWKAH